MCGRFTQSYTWAEVHEFLGAIGAPQNLRPNYNVAPTDPVGVVRRNTDVTRDLVTMRWGLVPFFWTKGLKEVPATFNARAETVASKPMFREAFRRRRCIVPASGFFEWTNEPDGKQPHLFTAADGSPILGFAGLWDRWRDPAGQDVLSCTIIVSGASAWMAPYHDRMPVLIAPQDVERWLRGDSWADMLAPAAQSALRAWPVSRRVNKTGVGVEDPTIVERVG